jgi:hypothetical protein
MNIALVCGNNHAIILSKVAPSIGARVDSFSTVSELASTQKPYSFDRLVVTSLAFAGKDQSAINQEAKILNNYRHTFPNVQIVFAIKSNESTLAQALANAFASPTCSVVSVTALGVQDLAFLVQGNLSDFPSKYNIVQPTTKSSVRQHSPQQVEQSKASGVGKPKKKGFFGFGKHKEAPTPPVVPAPTVAPVAPAVPAPVATPVKEKRGFFGFGKKHKNQQNLQNNQLQNEVPIQQQNQQPQQTAPQSNASQDFNAFGSQPQQQPIQNTSTNLFDDNFQQSSTTQNSDTNQPNAIFVGDVNSAENTPKNTQVNTQPQAQPQAQPVQEDVSTDDFDWAFDAETEVESQVQSNDTSHSEPRSEVDATVSTSSVPEASDIADSWGSEELDVIAEDNIPNTPIPEPDPSRVNAELNINTPSFVPPVVDAPKPTVPVSNPGFSPEAILDIASLENAYMQSQAPKVVEKVVEKRVVVTNGDPVANILNGASNRIILVTGDRSSGVTTTALEIAKFFSSQGVKTLYVDGDLETHGVLNYLPYDHISRYSKVQLQGTKLCSTISAFNQTVIKMSEFDILLSNYCTEISDDEFMLTQSVVAEVAHEYGVVVVDVPIQHLALCEDLLTGTPVVCVEASKRGYMNALYFLDKSNLTNRYKRVLQTKGTTVLTGARPNLDVQKLQKHIQGMVSSDINWMGMPSLIRQGSITKEFLNQILSN